ncbi:MAG: DUF6787 family protein [Dehalococcoidia bacterium]
MASGADRRITPARVGRLVVIFTVFGITGMLALGFSRLVLHGLFGMEGSIWSGPWSYRLAYVLLVPPFYSVTLVAVGTLLGQHTFFKRRVIRMWGRVLPFLRAR